LALLGLASRAAVIHMRVMRHKYPLSVMIFLVLAATLISTLESESAELQYIKAEELRRLIEGNDSTILVLDVQPKAAYDSGHIKGAVNFPWAMNIEGPVTLPRDKILILYCDCASEVVSSDILAGLTGKPESCSAEDDSTDVADQLMSKFGYKKLKILEGGWSRWQQLGYPIEKK
jgi:rhodanese-related sulfurtransferase